MKGTAGLNMTKLSDFDFFLPPESIAQYPARHRQESRLLILDRHKKVIQHRQFYDIISCFQKGDLLVLNDTKVLPARLQGRRQSGGRVEILLLRPSGKKKYYALIKPLGRLKVGEEIFLKGGFSCRLVDAKEKIVTFPSASALRVMKKVGLIPLPPYIRRLPSQEDKRRYQTVFAKREGAVAAPTAGLHFTRSLLKKISKMGVRIAFLTLHVNYATFSPVREENLANHRLSPEFYDIPKWSAALIRETKKNNKRIFAVGTTVVKTLETCADEILKSDFTPRHLSGASTLFIKPPYSFRLVDAMITNFHLPKTTLLMLVSAFADRELILSTYNEAIEKGYRFYSYGDATVIL
jgi:S-adenosylmethionine:tRNA ribosyltransferase-isomerase